MEVLKAYEFCRQNVSHGVNVFGRSHGRPQRKQETLGSLTSAHSSAFLHCSTNFRRKQTISNSNMLWLVPGHDTSKSQGDSTLAAVGSGLVYRGIAASLTSIAQRHAHAHPPPDQSKACIECCLLCPGQRCFHHCCWMWTWTLTLLHIIRWGKPPWTADTV